MIQVIPAIIPEELSDIESKVSRVRGLVDRVQVDFLDGEYVPGVFTWPFQGKDQQEEFKKITEEESALPFWDEVDYELDLMVSRPEKYVDDLIHAGAAALIIHHKSTENHSHILENTRANEVECGIAFVPGEFDGETEGLFALMKSFDFVQIMGSDNIGHSGVEFDEKVYEVVRTIRREFPRKDIAVDIGVSGDTAPRLVEAGVTKLVSGSAIFGSDNIGEAVRNFQNL